MISRVTGSSWNMNLTPLYFGGLWLAVTVAPPSTSRCFIAQYSAGVGIVPRSVTSAPLSVSPRISDSFSAGVERRTSPPTATRAPGFRVASARPTA